MVQLCPTPCRKTRLLWSRPHQPNFRPDSYTMLVVRCPTNQGEENSLLVQVLQCSVLIGTSTTLVSCTSSKYIIAVRPVCYKYMLVWYKLRIILRSMTMCVATAVFGMLGVVLGSVLLRVFVSPKSTRTAYARSVHSVAPAKPPDGGFHLHRPTKYQNMHKHPLQQCILKPFQVWLLIRTRESAD